jgi:hypothetical protein
MKGFKQFGGTMGRMPKPSGFTPSAPKCYAKGGHVTVGDQGNAVVKRAKPVTEFDAKDGGKGSLRTGYAEGGEAKLQRQLREKLGSQFTKKEAESLTNSIPTRKDKPKMIGKKLDNFLEGRKDHMKKLDPVPKTSPMIRKPKDDVTYLAEGGKVPPKRKRDLDAAIDAASGAPAPKEAPPPPPKKKAK